MAGAVLGGVAQLNVRRPTWAQAPTEQRASRVYRVVPSPRSQAEIAYTTHDVSIANGAHTDDPGEVLTITASREAALETLPLALPPIRFRRGEHPSEYDRLNGAVALRPGGDGDDASSPVVVPWTGSGSGGGASQTQLEWVVAEEAKRVLRESTNIAAELKPQMVGAVEKVAVALEAQMLEAMSHVCKQGVHAAPRGLAVPYQWYERVSGAAIAAVSEVFRTAMEFEARKYANATTPTGGTVTDAEHLAPSCGPDAAALARSARFTVEATHSHVEVITAVSAAVLWRMLEQVSGSVAGMRAALPLFDNLMNVIYVGFDQIRAILPDAASLADQVAQLVDLPVASLQRESALLDGARLLKDGQYLRRAMQNWSFKIWRQQMTADRRRDAFLDRLDAVVRKRECKEQKRLCVDAWRKFVGMRKLSRAFVKFEAEIGSVLSAEIAAVRRRDGRRPPPPKLVRSAVLKELPSEAPMHPLLKQQQQEQQQKDAKSGKKAAPPALAGLVSLQPKLLGGDDGDEAANIDSLNTTMPSGAGADETADEVIAPSDFAAVFDLVVSKAKDLTDVTGYLKQQITIQRERLAKLELENTNLKEKLAKTEDDLLRTIHEKLQLTNEGQLLRASIVDRDRQICRLKSRIRSQRHKNWRRAAVRIIAEIAEVDTNVSNTVHPAATHASDVGGARSKGFASSTDDPLKSTASAPGDGETMHRSASDAAGAASATFGSLELKSVLDNDGGSDTDDENDVGPEERAFAVQAPLVFLSTEQLPPAADIVRDWANNCLQDLCALDGSRVGADVTTQVSEFGNELKDGIVYTRLLFFLALPRYRPRTTRSADLLNVSEDCAENRKRLLAKKSVQLHPPFPTYGNCFADLLRLPYHQRAARILHFAESLMTQFSTRMSDEILGGAPNARPTFAGDATSSADGGASSLGCGGAASISLPEMINPIAMAEGVRGAHLTFLALLYVRFAHPFNHKCNAHIEQERVSLIKIIQQASSTSASSTAAQLSAARSNSSAILVPKHVRMPTGPAQSGGGSGGGGGTTGYDSDSHGDDEDNLSPWQLFVERCAPLVGSTSHSYVLDGNFWPADLVESSELLHVFGRIVLSLRHSLHMHRWHVTVNCLAPSRVYRGESRPALLASTLQGTSPADFIMRYAERLEKRRIGDPFGALIPNEVRVELDAVIAELLVTRGEVPPVATGRPGGATASIGSSFRAFVMTSEGDENEASGIGASPSMGAPDLRNDLSQTAQPVASPTDSLGLDGGDSAPGQWTEAHTLAVRAVRRAVLNSLNDITGVFMHYANAGADPDTLQLTHASFRALCVDAKLIPQFVSFEEAATVFSECDHAFRSRAGSLASNALEDQLGGGNISGAFGSGRFGFTARSSRRGSTRRGSVATIIDPAPQYVQNMSYEEFIEAVVRLSAIALRNAEQAAAAEAERAAAAAAAMSQQPSMLHSIGSDPLAAAAARRQKAGSVTPSVLRLQAPTPVLGPLGIAPQPSSPPQQPQVNPLGDSLASAIRAIAARNFAPLVGRSVPSVLESLMRGADTALLLRARNAELQSVFNAYARVFGGLEAIDGAAFSKLVKDAALVTHEFNFNVVNDIFAMCSVTTQVMVGAPSVAVGGANASTAAGGAPSGSGPLATKLVDKQLLLYDRFVDVVGIVAHYKNPNPFVPFANRLDAFLVTFLSTLRPRVEILDREKQQKQHLAQLLGKGPLAAAAAIGALNSGAGATASAGGGGKGQAATASVAGGPPLGPGSPAASSLSAMPRDVLAAAKSGPLSRSVSPNAAFKSNR